MTYLGLTLKNVDVILLQETWSNEGEEFYLDDYMFNNFPRKYRCKPSLRNSGGLCVFIRRDIAEGVHIVKSYHDVSVWLKLDKHLLGLVNGLYVANVYIVPENSVYLCHDVFHVLRDDISGFPCDSDVLVCGDYNARTGTADDIADSFLLGSNGELPSSLISTDTRHDTLIGELMEEGRLNRFSQDKSPVNKHGVHLIEFCKTIGLVKINGRLDQDKGMEKFTRVETTGCSRLYVVQPWVSFTNWWL